jgi:hypothetical protein
MVGEELDEELDEELGEEVDELPDGILVEVEVLFGDPFC